MISVAASPAPEVLPTSHDGLDESLDEDIAQVRAESRTFYSHRNGAASTPLTCAAHSRKTDETPQTVDLVSTIFDTSPRETFCSSSPRSFLWLGLGLALLTSRVCIPAIYTQHPPLRLRRHGLPLPRPEPRSTTQEPAVRHKNRHMQSQWSIRRPILPLLYPGRQRRRRTGKPRTSHPSSHNPCIGAASGI
jgi:hypothetical protein